jgi:carboxyl-terminal processing protease
VRGAQAVAVAAAVVAALCAGMWLGGHPADLPQQLRDAFVDESAGLTSEATDVIEENYFRDVDAVRLRNSSIDGMVRALRRRYKDRFSHYFDPEDLKRFEESITGRFSGVGLTVSQVDRGLRVVRVFPRTPAARAGIEAGDVIVSVDGRSIAGKDSEVATERIRGPAGTKVTIGVRRPSSDRTRSVILTRTEIEVPITAGKVRVIDGRKLGYVQLASFSDGAHVALRRAVQRIEEKGAHGIVLDLRGNGGGLLQEAKLTASIFLPKDEVVVSTRSRTQGDKTYKTVGDNLPPRPVVVLIDRDTASAAEILTAALADDSGATVVGTRSFGKGVFQQVIDLSNGGALDLTIGEYFTPDGVNLAGKGVHPDVRALDDPHTKADEGLRKALRVLLREVGAGAGAAGGG